MLTIRRRLIGTFVITCVLVFLAWMLAGSIGNSTDNMFHAVKSDGGINMANVEAAEHASMVASRIYAGYSAAIIAFVAVAGWSLARRVVGGCLALQKGADEFTRGNLAYRISWPENDEFGRLASQFNDMVTHLARARGETDVSRTLDP